MVEYSSCKIYIDSATTIEARIAAIDAIILALETTALNAAENGDTTEYYLDTGQSKVTYKYRSPLDIINALALYDGMRQRYISRLNGRMVRQLPEQNFRHTRWR